MKDHLFSGKYSISFISFLAEFKQACDSSRIPEGATLSLFRDLWTVRHSLRLKRIWQYIPNNVNAHQGTSISYAEAVNPMLRWYATDSELAKADDQFLNFEQGKLTTGFFSQKLRDFRLCCGDFYIEETGEGYFAEELDLSIRSMMRQLWAKQPRRHLKVHVLSCTMLLGPAKFASSWGRGEAIPRSTTLQWPRRKKQATPRYGVT